MIDVSIVIPTFQRPDSLQRLLLALGRQSIPPDCFEAIVAIDGIADASEGVLRQLQVPYSLRWTAGSRAGPGATRNRGVMLASGDVILFLDDDMMPTPSLLAEHLATHKDATDRVCLGRVRVLPEMNLSPWETYLNRRFEAHYDKMDQSGYRPNFWDCLSGNVSLRRELFTRCEGFDPSFAVTRHEDIELGYRLARQGARFIYQPRALSYHRFSKTLDEGLRDAFNNGASAMRFAHHHPALAPRLIQARWRRYPQGVRRLMRWTIAQPKQQTGYTKLVAQVLRWTDRRFLSSEIMRPLCQLAYHLHFWQGVQEEARPGELDSLLSGVPEYTTDPDSQ